jgi:hypothetical protein
VNYSSAFVIPAFAITNQSDDLQHSGEPLLSLIAHVGCRLFIVRACVINTISRRSESYLAARQLLAAGVVRR